MDAAESTMNQALVTLFNRVLRIEEQALQHQGLSIREVHVIEAVAQATDPHITVLAGRLHVTRGSLSVAVSTLERKGYLERIRRKDDRRMVDIRLTPKAVEIQAKHEAFHQQMVTAVMAELSPRELNALTAALCNIDSYFMSKGY
jgi:DNA-binding MarR family transcriptional regulator